MGRIFWKFFFAFWLTLLTAVLVTAGLVWLRHFDSTIDDKTFLLDQHATAFLSSAVTVAKHSDHNELAQFLEDLGKSPAPIIYAVDHNNQDLLGKNLDPTVAKQVRQRYLTEKEQTSIRFAITKNGHELLLFSLLPDHHRERFPPPARQHGSPPPPNHGGPLPPRPPPPFLLIIIISIASLIFSVLLAWYFTQPIKHLRDAFTDVSSGNLKTRVHPLMQHRQDELADLGNKFDDMVSKIQNLISAQQQLLHDVSHELRSPLARMQAAIGVAQQQPKKTPETMKRLEKEIQRINELIGELLTLSHLTAIDKSDLQQRINFSSFMEDIIEDARYEAAERSIIINYQPSPPIQLIAHPEFLHRAIENIIRNAIKFSPDGGEVLIISYLSDRKITLSIKDQGPGVAEKEIPNIFHPFYQSEKNVGGSGLGLAIAARAVEKHGGSILASNRSEAGLNIEIHLPINTKESTF
jgi:two-component system OmpR family sensor kinase